MSVNLRTLGGGGAPAIPILKSVIGAGTLFFSAACLLACKTARRDVKLR